MSDIAQILGVSEKSKEELEEKKPKKAAKKDPYANLPRYLRDIVDENNPPPPELFQEKKSTILCISVSFSSSNIKRTC